MSEPTIKVTTIGEFRPQQANPNKHTQRGLAALDKAMSDVGYVAPMTAAADGEILDGSARLETAAVRFGDEVIVIEHDGTRPIIAQRTDVPDAQSPIAKAISYSANRIAELDLDWDVEQIAADLAAGVALEALWSDRELAELLSELPPGDADAEPQIDKAEELRVKWGVESGQLWQLGAHRLVCGDCTDKAVVERVMGGEKAALVFTDPPYNVAYSGRGQSTQHQTIENDDMAEGPFIEWLTLVCQSLASVLLPGANVYLCHGDTGRHSLPFIEAFTRLGWTRSATIIWAKQAASMGWQDYRSQHECISYGWLPGDHYFTSDRSQTTLWQIDRDGQASYMHPTQKPVELPARAIGNSSRTGDIVLDGFLGSGTTLIACENLRRKCRAIEISPGYVGVSLQRFYDTTNITPVLIPEA